MRSRIEGWMLSASSWSTGTNATSLVSLLVAIAPPTSLALKPEGELLAHLAVVVRHDVRGVGVNTAELRDLDV